MRQITLFLLLMFSFATIVGAQEKTSIDVNFEDGKTAFTPIFSDGDQPSYVLEVVDNVLQITCAKREQDWSFLGLFGFEHDISALPTLQFRVKTDTDVSFAVRLKSAMKSNPEEMTEIKYTVDLVASEDFTYYFFDLTSKIEGNADFDPTLIKEIHLEATKGWNDSYSGVVYLDFLKVGFAEQLLSGGTGFSQTFDETTLPEGAKPNAKFSLAAVDGAMEVDVHRSSGRWAYFDYELGARYDFSAKPIVNFKVKAQKSMVLQLFLVDVDGNGYKAKLESGQYDYMELVSGKYEYRQARVYQGDEFIDVCFDFSEASSDIVDLSNIIALRFVANGTANTFNGVFYVDDIRIGDQAEKKAYIGQLPDATFPENAGGTKTLIIPEIHNAETVEITGTPALITNATIAPVTYNTVNEFYKNTTYGNSSLSFDVKPDVSGTETIILTAKGKNGYSDNSISFDITIDGNNAPTIDLVQDIKAMVGKEYTVKLTGISDGDPEAMQTLTIDATSNETSVVSQFETQYIQGFQSGVLVFTPIAAGKADVNLKLTDSKGVITETSFALDVYEALNGKPRIAHHPKVDMYKTSGTKSITLTGIHDGDDMSQNLTITASSNNTDLILEPEVTYNQGNATAELTLTPGGTQTGITEITVEIADNGGNAQNDGNQTTTMTFEVEVTEEPVTGYEIDLGAEGILDIFGPEQNNVAIFISIVDTLGSKTLRVTMKDKWTYGGIFTHLPQELNLSEYPIVSYEVFSIDKSSWHWNYFYDAHGRDAGVNRNIENTGQHEYEAPANEWTTLTFDYRDPGDMNNSQGTPIDGSRINGLLINMHDIKPSWPFTDGSGVFYIRNIKFGDKAVFEAFTPTCSMDDIPNQAVFAEQTTHTMQLSGISNGDGSTEGVAIAAESSNENVISNITVGQINEDGTATLSYDVKTKGNVKVTLNIEADGSNANEMVFYIKVLDNDPATYSAISYDLNDERQTIRGLGTFYTDARFADLYATDLGASAVRIGIIGNQWEPVNDNSDPDVINMDGFDYSAFDWEYFKKLKAQGVEVFIITSWSPPAWMKRNLSLDHRGQAIAWEKTDNILEPYYYEEFAESMAAVVKAFKDKCDIDILAVGLQNEPYFNEPYSSAILSGEQFAKLLKITGDRFKTEGLEHVGFYMPEQVFGDNWGKYSNEGYLELLREDPDADAYTDYLAVHGYDGTGITSGFPSYSNWQSLYEKASEGSHPKELWMSETHIGYEDWNSALSTAGAIHGSLWAGNITLWTNWSFETMQLTKNKPNSTFYASKNFFKYIRPGAVRVHTESDHEDFLATAFLNPDGTLVSVIINKGTMPRAVQLRGGRLPQEFQVYKTSASENCINAGTYMAASGAFIVPAKTVVTLVADQLGVLSMEQVQDVSIEENAMEQTLQITGIALEDGDVSDLTLSYENSNDALFSNFEISDIQNNGTANITFTPATDQTGEALISLTLADKSGSSITNYFTITVEEIVVTLTIDQVDNVTINENESEQTISLSGISVDVGDMSSLSLSYASTNDGLFSKFEISDIANDGTATITYMPTADAYGEAIITLTLEDNSGNSIEQTFTITVEEDPSSAITNPVYNEISIYPVPAQEKLTIELNGNIFTHYRVTDLSGTTIRNAVITSDKIQLNTSRLSSGMYFIKFSGEQRTTTRKFVIE